MTEFSFRVNDRAKVRKIKTVTGIYQDAAAAIPAMFGIQDFPLKITIWCEDLIQSGLDRTYDYVIERDPCGGTLIRHYVRLLTFTLNGARHNAGWDANLSFDQIAGMAWPTRILTEGYFPTIIHTDAYGRSYTLTPGNSVTLKDGMRIECVFTDKA